MKVLTFVAKFSKEVIHAIITIITGIVDAVIDLINVFKNQDKKEV